MQKVLLTLLFTALFLQSNAQGWNEIRKIVASDRISNDNFGGSIAVSGNYAIIGAPYVGGPSFGGAVYIYEKSPAGIWVEVQKIRSSDIEFDDRFGVSVAISGDYAVVGANQEDHNASGGDMLLSSGSAYIYERDTGGTWNEVQKIVAPDRDFNDQFGYSVSISGTYVLAGAFFEKEDAAGGNTLQGAGSAYLFERDGGGNWNFAQKIVPADRDASDNFGRYTSLDGTYAAIGAKGEDEDATGGNTMSEAGSVYVFERDVAGNWNEVQKVVASDRAIGDCFSSSIAIHNNFLIVGAIGEDEDTLGGDTKLTAGSAYIFERDAGGVWNEAQKIVASDRSAVDMFGSAVAINGTLAIVGAHYEDHNATGSGFLNNAGSAYFYLRDAGGNWNEVQKVVASDRYIDDNLGTAIATNGIYTFFGTRYEDENEVGTGHLADAGSAYVFAACTTGTTTGTDTVVACNSYTSPSGQYTWTTSGTYVDNVFNSAGCDSILTINLTVNTIDTSVTAAGPILTANASGVTYQWLDCNNNFSPINGETGQSYTATTSGLYAVEVSQTGCTDISSCHQITIVGLNENNHGLNLTAHPNPTTGLFTIDLGQEYNNIAATIRNTLGQIISTQNYISTRQFNLEINQPAGVYFVEVRTKTGLSKTLKIIKH
jgi:hypothetical protein